MPKISVIVPVYKVEDYLARCIESILGQTFSDFDLILVDDGSPDNCGKICDEYAQKDNRIVVIHKENGGRSDARNNGIDWSFANSTSDWITFIDGDDWVHTQYLELMYDACIEHGVKMSSCGFEIVFNQTPDKLFFDKPKIEVDTPEAFINSHFSYSEYNSTILTCRLYHKSLWEHERFPLGKIHEDEYTTYKLIFSCDRIAIVRKSLYYYFQNENSITHSELSPERLADKLIAFKERAAYFYSKGFFSAFRSTFCYFCKRIEEERRTHKSDPAFKTFFKTEKKYIKKALKKYAKHLPKEMRGVNYKKWLKKPYLKQYRNDFKMVKKEKGAFFSVLWALKNRWNV